MQKDCIVNTYLCTQNNNIMAYTGRCWYCGSEDVEDYSDGSHECMECGMTWGGRQYVQQPTYHRTYSRKGENKHWERSMQPYREKWRRERKKNPMTNLTIKNNGKKWYDAEVQVTNRCAVPAVLYFFIAIMVYGFAGLMLYVACSS